MALEARVGRRYQMSLCRLQDARASAAGEKGETPIRHRDKGSLTGENGLVQVPRLGEQGSLTEQNGLVQDPLLVEVDQTNHLRNRYLLMRCTRSVRERLVLGD